jgi:hypothetical protein
MVDDEINHTHPTARTSSESDSSSNNFDSLTPPKPSQGDVRECGANEVAAVTLLDVLKQLEAQRADCCAVGERGRWCHHWTRRCWATQGLRTNMDASW